LDAGGFIEVWLNTSMNSGKQSRAKLFAGDGTALTREMSAEVLKEESVPLFYAAGKKLEKAAWYRLEVYQSEEDIPLPEQVEGEWYIGLATSSAVEKNRIIYDMNYQLAFFSLKPAPSELGGTSTQSEQSNASSTVSMYLDVFPKKNANDGLLSMKIIVSSPWSFSGACASEEKTCGANDVSCTAIKKLESVSCAQNQTNPNIL